MEVVGPRGYYEMKAINECEGKEEERDREMENCMPVCALLVYVCVLVDEAHLLDLHHLSRL